MRDHTHPAAALHALALVAAARAALAAARGIGDRRAGRDPSTQEPEAPVRADLAVLHRRLAGHVARLRLRVVLGDLPDETPAAALARAFEDRLLLDDLARDARRAHQKLLSLYPDVTEKLVEEARVVAAAAARLATDPDEASVPAWGDLAERAADWLDLLADEVA